MTAGRPITKRVIKIRKFSWFILAVQVLFIVWIIAGIASAGDNGCTTKACNDASAVGTTLGVGIIVFLWVMVDVILGVIWLVTNNRKPRGSTS